MDASSLLTSALNNAGLLLHGSPALTLLTDLLIKSVGVLGVFLLADMLIGQKLTSSSRHLLWLNALLCLAILPWVPAVVGMTAPTTTLATNALFEITVSTTSSVTTSTTNWNGLILALYLLPCIYLLTRMAVAMRRLRLIRVNSRTVQDPAMLATLETCRQQLGISRPLTLRYSNTIESPLSFGLFAPQIILPSQARSWSSSVITDVLLHELSHIRRLDWSSMLLGYLVACVYWMNPLVWRVLKNLHDQAENSCDSAVIHAGRSDTDYAESLLSVAQACRHTRHKPHDRKLLAQMMLDRNTLKTRINRLFEENVMKASEFKKEMKKSAVFLFLVSAGLLTALGTMQIVSAQTQPEPRSHPQTRGGTWQELSPVHTQIPNYPTVAADQGIEGWVHMRFTINETGTVDENSIVLLDAEPAEIFNNSARNALTQFTFQPRRIDGQAVAVPNVEYVFRYALEDESE